MRIPVTLHQILVEGYDLEVVFDVETAYAVSRDWDDVVDDVEDAGF